MKLLRIKLDDSLHARLKVQAAMRTTSMQDLAASVVEDWIVEAEMLQTSREKRLAVEQNHA